MDERAAPLIGIVGPCSAGKSSLGRALRERGYRVKEIRQEHCAMPGMWQRLTNPALLIYLDVSLEEAARREHLSAPSSWWVEEREVRLAHARQHCDIYIDTSTLNATQVLEEVLHRLAEIEFWPKGE